MQAADAGKFKDQKGKLPWPVDGKRLSAKAMAEAGARGHGGGVGFATADGAAVRAVFPGRGVGSDLLRGYGHVVILSHGDNWYTLYAFLREDAASQGREVASGATLGHAGYYPAAKGSGVYFELRSGQKAINPVEWLAQRP
jgi:septal ring factor EnvC (AmiA/AmiB activator)